MSKKPEVEWTWFELSAIAQGLALLQARIEEPAHRKHAPAVATAYDKLLALASHADLLEAKA